MEYIDIDSTYRNRNQFPKQAQFKVLRQQDHSCNIDCTSTRDAVSGESIIFPNPQQNPPLSYYEETIQQPQGTIVTKSNLPYMYQTETNNIVQLDELPLSSYDPTSTLVQSNTLYPRNSIPLGEANEYYTGNILEDVTNGEFRKITSFVYDSNVDNVFQTGVVQSYIPDLSGKTFLTLSPGLITQIPFSNITHFYQGKFLKMLSGNASGQSKLIINYTTTTNTQYTFELESSFGVSIVTGDSFAVVSDRKWFATLESPFTNLPSAYPCYRNLIPSNVTFTSNVIVPETDFAITFARTFLQSVEGNGANNIAINTIQDTNTSLFGVDTGIFTHYTSNDKEGKFSFTPQFKVENVILRTRFGSTYTRNPYGVYNEIELFSPKIIYATILTAVDWEVRLLEGIDINGTTWNNSIVLATYSGPNVNSFLPEQNIVATAASIGSFSNGDTIFAAWVKYDGDYDIDFYNGTSVTTIHTDSEILRTIDMKIVSGNPAILFTQNNSPYDTELYYIRATNASGGTWATPVKIDDISNSYFDFNLGLINNGSNIIPHTVPLVENYSGPDTIIAYGNNATGSSWSISTNSITNLLFDITRVIQTNIQGINIPIVLGIDTTQNNLWLLIGNTTSPTTGQTNFNGLNLIDSNNVLNVDVISNYNDEPFIIYSRFNNITNRNELVTLNLTSFIIQECSTYRIRKGIPIFSGTPFSNKLVSSTTSSVVLPDTILQTNNFFKCMFLHLTSANLYEYSGAIFNNFLLIQSYDSQTNEITFSPHLSTSPSTIEATTYQDFSVVALNFTNSANIGEDFSPNNYDFSSSGAISYVASYTDTNGLLLSNIIRSDSDTEYLERTFTITDIPMQEVFSYGTRITIAMWINIQTFIASKRRLVYIEGENGSWYIEIYATNASQIVIFFKAIYGDLQYELSILPDIWYHFVYVHTEFGVKVYINKEDVSSSLNLVLGNLNSPYPTFDNEEIGLVQIAGAGPTASTDVVYMKNILLTGQVFDQINVNTNYDAAFSTNTYLNWEILGSIEDSFNPLDYFGTKTNLDERCYQLELTHLTLPNVILKTGFGNRIAFYPYVYVEFSNNNTMTKYFYSNNPHAKRVIFKVPIRDTSVPERATFVNNTSGMRIKSKFNPNDNFDFAVYLPNGELFETFQTDTLPPQFPDELLQLSATIGFKIIE